MPHLFNLRLVRKRTRDKTMSSRSWQGIWDNNACITHNACRWDDGWASYNVLNACWMGSILWTWGRGAKCSGSWSYMEPTQYNELRSCEAWNVYSSECSLCLLHSHTEQPSPEGYLMKVMPPSCTTLGLLEEESFCCSESQCLPAGTLSWTSPAPHVRAWLYTLSSTWAHNTLVNGLLLNQHYGDSMMY